MGSSASTITNSAIILSIFAIVLTVSLAVIVFVRTGPKGETGPQGKTGPQGETGPKGDYFYTPVLEINENGWSSTISLNNCTAGLKITTLKTMKVTAVGCKSNLLLGNGDTRTFTIYDSSKVAVGGPYTINKTVLNESKDFVKFNIPTLPLVSGTYYFAMTLQNGDYYNYATVTDSYTVLDSSVISVLTGCFIDASETTLAEHATKSFGMFWVDTT